MSLFNARDKQLVEKNPYLKLPQDAGPEDGNILDPMLFQTILHRVIDEQKADAPSDYRTRINDCRWRIQNLLGHINEQGWEAMVKASLKGMEATIHNAQPNGTWVPCQYESRISQNGKTMESFLEVVVRFVDTANAPELAYQDGRPVVNVTVQQSAPAMDQKVLDMLAQKAESDADMKVILAGVVQLLAKQTSAVDTLPAKPLREEEPEAPRARRGRPAAETVETNTDRAALAALSELPVIK